MVPIRTQIQVRRDNVDASLARLDQALAWYSDNPHCSLTRSEVYSAQSEAKFEVNKLEIEVYRAKLHALDNLDLDIFDQILAWTAKVNSRVFQALDL